MTNDKLQEARSLIGDLLHSTFPNTHFVEIQVHPDLDHEGDEVLRVDAFYRGEEDIDPATDVALLPEMRDRLRAIGINAFPIHRFRDIDERPYRGSS